MPPSLSAKSRRLIILAVAALLVAVRLPAAERAVLRAPTYVACEYLKNP